MLKVLGGQCRSIPVVDGKVNLVLKAVVPAPADKEKAEKLCSLNGWAPHTDMFNNLLITAPVSLDAYRLSDSSVMNAYIGFAEKAATALVDVFPLSCTSVQHIGQSQRVCWNVSKTFPKNSNPLSMIITSKCSRLHFSTMIRESFSKVIFVMSSIICIKSGPKKNIKHLHNR